MMHWVCHIHVGTQGFNMLWFILSLLISLALPPFHIIQHFVSIILLGSFHYSEEWHVWLSWCHFMFSAWIIFGTLTRNTHKGIKFDCLVCSCAILILSRMLTDPKVDIMVKLLTNQVLVSLPTKLFPFASILWSL